MGSKHIADQMSECLDRTFYRGGDHKYGAPIVDIRLIAATNRQTSNSISVQAN